MLNGKQRIEYAFNMELFIGDMHSKSGSIALHDIEALTGVDKSVLSRWQNKITLPSMENFMKICAALQLEPKNYFDKQTWELKK